MARLLEYETLRRKIDELYDSKTEQSDEQFRLKVIIILYMLADMQKPDRA